MSFTPPDIGLRPLESLINGALAYDPGSRAAIAGLTGRTLAIATTLPPILINVRFEAGGSVVLGGDSLGGDRKKPADLRLSGSPAALARLLARAGDTYSFAGTGVAIEGDHELLRQVGHIVQRLDIDWEQALAGIFGDTPAHLAGRAVRDASGWLAETMSRALSGMGEFVREESGTAVGNVEAGAWIDDVRQLAAASDRLDARVQRIRDRLDGAGPDRDHD